MNFESKRYFWDYADKAGSIVRDMCGIANGMMLGKQVELTARLALWCREPIHRGFEVEDGKKHFKDAYLYKGKVYTSEELSKHLKKNSTVQFDMLVNDSSGNYIPKHMSIGIGELFYYKKNVDGVPDDYVEEPVHLRAVGIEWDTDGEEVNLPTEMDVPDYLYEEEISDWLTEETGFCHKGFQVERIPASKVEEEDMERDEI